MKGGWAWLVRQWGMATNLTCSICLRQETYFRSMKIYLHNTVGHYKCFYDLKVVDNFFTSSNIKAHLIEVKTVSSDVLSKATKMQFVVSAGAIIRQFSNFF